MGAQFRPGLPCTLPVHAARWGCRWAALTLPCLALPLWLCPALWLRRLGPRATFLLRLPCPVPAHGGISVAKGASRACWGFKWSVHHTHWGCPVAPGPQKWLCVSAGQAAGRGLRSQAAETELRQGPGGHPVKLSPGSLAARGPAWRGWGVTLPAINKRGAGALGQWLRTVRPSPAHPRPSSPCAALLPPPPQACLRGTHSTFLAAPSSPSPPTP